MSRYSSLRWRWTSNLIGPNAQDLLMFEVMSVDSSLPPLNLLRVFEASARLRSFTQAGRELHLTQSAVSQQMKALEAHIGRPLFLRQPRGVDLTEAGRAYLPVVQRALDALATGTQSVFGRHDETHLTVQANLSFAIFWLTPKLQGFLDLHPNVTVDLVTVNHEPERTSPAADIEIRFGEHAAGAALLRRNRYFPVCAPAHAGEADWSTDRLFDCLAVQGTWRSWLGEQGEELPNTQRIHASNTYATAQAAAEHGAGLAMTLDTFAEDAIGAGRLAQPFDHVAQTPESYWILDPRPGHNSELSRAFTDWLLG